MGDWLMVGSYAATSVHNLNFDVLKSAFCQGSVLEPFHLMGRFAYDLIYEFHLAVFWDLIFV